MENREREAVPMGRLYPAETGGQAQGVQTKKERTEYNNESEENGKA